jgi:hypothetical protein
MQTQRRTILATPQYSPRRPLRNHLVSMFMAMALFCGCDPAVGAGKLVGDILSDLQTRVSQTMSDTSTEANALLVNAGTQVQLALDSTKSAVADLMDKGYNQVNATVQDTLNQAQAMVDDLDSKVTEQLQKAVKGAQQLSNSIPFIGDNPQVTSYSPVYVSGAADVGETVAIDIKGNFKHAHEAKLNPTMTWDGANAPLTAGVLNTQELTFFVPSALLRRQPTDKPLRRVTLTLQIPYERGAVFKSIKPGEFHLTVTVLPPSPVKSLVLHDVRAITDNPSLPPRQEETLIRPDPPEHVYSYDCEDKDVRLGPFHPKDGWSIDPGSITVIKEYPKGDQRSSVEVVESSSSAVSVRVQTQAACVLGISNGSGNVYVSLGYTQFYQPPKPPPTTTETETTEDVTGLTWGGTVIRGVTQNRWKLDAVLFDGTGKSYNGTDVSNPYVRVAYEQGSHTVNISSASTDDLTVKP